MFTALGRFTARHPWWICAAWLVVGAVLASVAPSWQRGAQDDDIRFLPARCPSVRGYRLLEQAFPQEVYASRLLYAVQRDDRRLGDDDFALADAIADDLARLRQDEPALQIKQIVDHRDPFIGGRLVSADGHCTLVQVSLGTPYLALQTRATVDRATEVVTRRVEQIGADAPAVHVTGPAGVGRDLIAAGGDSLDATTVATVVLVLVILLVVYRSPLLALIPLISIAVAVWVAISILALLTLIPDFYLVNISQIFAVVMLYGAGTDYCLFLVSRYREELGQGGARSAALARAVGGVGGALAASAGTVICGLGLMALAEFAKVRCGGPAIAVSLAVALLASLTLTPALLAVVGRAAFWPVGLPRRLPVLADAADAGVWNWISRQVVARPALIGLTAGLLLLPLAVLGLRVRPSYRATAELAPACSSVRGLAAISRHFTPGELGPVSVLLESSADWDTPAGRRVIELLYSGFSRLPNVAEVRCLTHPLGKPVEEPPAAPAQLSQGGSLFASMWRNVAQNVRCQINRAARGVYLARMTDATGVARHVTRLDVVLHSDPFDPRSNETLDRLQLWLDDELPRLAGAATRAEIYGISVNARDLALVTESDRQRINLLVAGGVFLILLLVVRQPLLAAYLLVTVLLSYYATLGAAALLAQVWHGRPPGEIDWRVPFFLFTILVAVGEDYNILLISRAMEEKRKYGGIEGTRRALAATGGTITSCGLIMAGTFATLLLAGLNTLQQIGFALAFGVLLDTFLVRPLLVPAFTVWLWRDHPPAPLPEIEPRHEPVVLSRRRAA